MIIHPLPALDSNYFWLLQPDPARNAAYIIDPGDPEPVLAALARLDLQLAGILVTHHHWDHTDGIDALLSRYPVPVYGPHSARIPQVSHCLREGDTLNLPGVTFRILALPGHTLDHIAYWQDLSPAAGALFCGDALFGAGCGRLFEGEPAQMLASLEKLAQLPDTTQVYCAHEYTLANLAFARELEPDNPDVLARCKQALALRRAGRMTLPSTIALERRTNPFLRCHLSALKSRAEAHAGSALNTPAAVFACLRRWKDQFQPGEAFLDPYPRNP